MIEAGWLFRDFSLDNPIRAIRDVSHDVTGRRPVRLADGREVSALDIQHEYLSRARDFADRKGPDPLTERVLDLWELTLRAVSSGDFAQVASEIDWVTKHQLFERYRAKLRPAAVLAAGRAARPGLPRHAPRARPVRPAAAPRRGERACRDLDIFEAKSVPPQTTRARLRGEFIRRRRNGAATSPSTGCTSS